MRDYIAPSMPFKKLPGTGMRIRRRLVIAGRQRRVENDRLECPLLADCSPSRMTAFGGVRGLSLGTADIQSRV
ncbi:hypothetical protein EMIT0324P_20710 [Pseudomonas chlororaphis]